MPRQQRRSITVAVSGALVLVLAAATALYFGVLRSPGKLHPGALATSNAKASSKPKPKPSASLGPAKHIGSRALDPKPLTIAQLYPRSFTVKGWGSVARTAAKIGTNCGAATAGAKIQQALSAGDCNQVVRATYLASKLGVMGTIGVLNLRSASSATKAARSAGATNFIAPLPGRGPTSKIGQGTLGVTAGIETFYAKGHYLILVWAEFTSLHKPTTAKQQAELDAFMAKLVNNTANLDLTTRMLTGSP